MTTYEKALTDFIRCNPTGFHVVEAQGERLSAAGYRRLYENTFWELVPGGKYYLTRNGSALIAFTLPQRDPEGFMIMASHSDSPALRIKVHPEICSAGYTTLNVEAYGGAVLQSWFDRPLSVAGRITLRTEEGMRVVNVNIDRDLLMIPGLAIHQNPKVNEGMKINIQKDLLPLFAMGEREDLLSLVAESAGVLPEEILSHELSLYVRSAPAIWGKDDAFLSSPRLDDVQCAFASLEGFLSAEAQCAIPVHTVFDNEEVGSGTRQGAASTFLKDTLERIAAALDPSPEMFYHLLGNSMMLSADNAHAVHPNYPERSDPVDHPVLGGGIVIKSAANQKYTTDAVSEGLCRWIAEKAGVKLQRFVNRSDQPGGSTLGNLSSHQVPVITADIGIAQLSMHSAYETCGTGDTDRMIALAAAFFQSALRERLPGEFTLI